MNQDILRGKWKQLRGTIKDRWGRLTDDDLDRIDGRVDRLVGTIQERYGWAKQRVESEIDAALAPEGEEPAAPKSPKRSGETSH